MSRSNGTQKAVSAEGKGAWMNLVGSLVTDTKERAVGLVEDLQKRGGISRRSAQKLKTEMKKRGSREREDLKRLVDNRILELSKMLGIVTKRDLDRIHERLRSIEKKLL